MSAEGPGIPRGPSYSFSRHARRRLQLARLTPADAMTAYEQATTIRESIKGRWNAWAQIGGRWLRVTYRPEGDRIVIITVTVRRRGPDEG